MVSFDRTLFYFFNNFAGASRVSDALIIFFAEYLPYVLVFVFLALLYRAAYSRREKLFMLWTAVISVAVARGIITEMIRFFYHRPRPFLALHARQLLFENEWSFPSGHSAFFFAMATAIFLSNKKWGAWFFVAAIAMNVSRIVAGAHYPSDILGGAVVGMVVGYSVVRLAEKWKPKTIGKLP